MGTLLATGAAQEVIEGSGREIVAVDLSKLKDSDKTKIALRFAFEGIGVRAVQLEANPQRLAELPRFIDHLLHGTSCPETLISFDGARVSSFEVSRDGQSRTKAESHTLLTAMLRNPGADRAFEIKDLARPFAADTEIAIGRNANLAICINPHVANPANWSQEDHWRHLRGTELGAQIKAANQNNLVLMFGPQNWRDGKYIVVEIPHNSGLLATNSTLGVDPRALELLGFSVLNENPDHRTIQYGYEHADKPGKVNPTCPWMNFPYLPWSNSGELVLGVVPKTSDSEASLVIAVSKDGHPNAASTKIFEALQNPESHGLNGVSAAILPSSKKNLFEKPACNHIYFELNGAVNELGLTLHRLLDIGGSAGEIE